MTDDLEVRPLRQTTVLSDRQLEQLLEAARLARRGGDPQPPPARTARERRHVAASISHGAPPAGMRPGPGSGGSGEPSWSDGVDREPARARPVSPAELERLAREDVVAARPGTFAPSVAESVDVAVATPDVTPVATPEVTPEPGAEAKEAAAAALSVAKDVVAKASAEPETAAPVAEEPVAEEPVAGEPVAAGQPAAPRRVARRRRVRAKAGPAFVCHKLTATYRKTDRPTIHDVSFSLPTGGLVAVLGPSGSGKSTMCAAMLGEIDQVSGTVELGGEDLLGGDAVQRRIVSYVPQVDALHLELTPRQALELVGELRLADSVPQEDRERHVEAVLAKLEMSAQADVRIGNLSAGQRKRVAVATELLSDPALLMLDEPTAGLDEGLGHTMMTLLRKIADDGRTVLVVTHSTTTLDLVNLVVVLDGQGRVAYSGSPRDMLDSLGVGSYPEAMVLLRAGLPRPESTGSGAAADRVTAADVRAVDGGAAGASNLAAAGARGLGFRHSTRVLLRRELMRLRAQPLTLARSVLLLPVLTCLLTMWACDRGLAGTPTDPSPYQGIALSVLITCTMFFGMALSFSTIVSDRAVIEREHRWGVPPISVVLAKALALVGPAALQSVVGYGLFSIVRDGPSDPLGDVPSVLVMMGSLAVLGFSSTALGLFVSAASRSLERVVLVLMGTVALLVALTGLLIPLGNPSNAGVHLLAWISQVTPGRWGAGTIAAYLGYVPPPRGALRVALDPLWHHDATHVLTALISLVVLTVAYTLGTAQLLTVQAHRRR